MNNSVEKYLPIGSVVLLKDNSKKFMITGFCIKPEESVDKMFDYSGCLYPEGILSSHQNILFNHDQIEKICYMGLMCDEEIKFKAALKTLVNEMPKEFVINEKDAKISTDQAPSVPATPQQKEDDVPPIGPGLPGYVAPNLDVIEESDSDQTSGKPQTYNNPFKMNN